MALSISFIDYIAAQVIPIGTMKHMLSRDHMSGRHDELDYLLTNIIEFELRSLTIAHTKKEPSRLASFLAIVLNKHECLT